MEGSASATIPQPLPSIQTRTRTPVIDVQMDVVPKVSLNLGQTSVQDRDQWLPWLVTKPGRQEAKAAKLQLGLTTLPGHRCAQIHRQTDNNGVCLFVFGFFFFPQQQGTVSVSVSQIIQSLTQTQSFTCPTHFVFELNTKAEQSIVY